MNGALRGLVIGRLGKLSEGVLSVRDRDRSFRLGEPAPDGLAATMTVHDPRFWRRVALGGALAGADAFVDGDWSTDDLVSVVRVFVRNADAMARVESGVSRIGRTLDVLAHALNRNTRGESRENIRRHYDLGNDLFERILDPTMTYSCGYFESPRSSLEEASLAKIDRILDKLELRKGHHLLEIGTGWGALAIRAAERYGCRVTTTTLSLEQAAMARERVAARRLADRVSVETMDYRDLRGRFDRIVSVEMIEAIGAAHYDAFFAACERLVGPAGVVALQAITLPDNVFEAARRDVDFIRARIFPGSEIPSVTALLTSATRATALRLHHLEEIGPHYVPTLRLWRENLERAREEIIRGRGEAFYRAFTYYLAYCEAGFAERYLGDVQLVLRGPRAKLERGAPPR